MGEHDLAEGVLARLAARLLFDAVAIQPGKPLVFGVHVPRSGAAAGLVFGLPGNPASVMVAFWLFVRPALRRLLGFEDSFWRGGLAANLTSRYPPVHPPATASCRRRSTPAARCRRSPRTHPRARTTSPPSAAATPSSASAPARRRAPRATNARWTSWAAGSAEGAKCSSGLRYTLQAQSAGSSTS